MSVSSLCEVCRAINGDAVSQMFAAKLIVNISHETSNLLKHAAREIQDEDVRNWALNELKGVFHDDNSS
jgi:hypothetical protein